MTPSVPSAVPPFGGDSAHADGSVWATTSARIPSLSELRTALRPPNLPLPAPQSVREAAHRISDLVHAERFAEARSIAANFRTHDASPEDRMALLRAEVSAHAASGQQEDWARAATALIDHLHSAGYPVQAQATAQVLLTGFRSSLAERRRERSSLAGVGSSSGDEHSPATGRRRVKAHDAPPAMLAVVRALSDVPLGTQVDPRREASRMQGALRALDQVEDQVLGDARTVITLRLAQALEGAGQHADATSRALDVLDMLSAGAFTGTDTDPDRAATSAHAVLARSLATTQPLEAANHALTALMMLRDVDDPPLRIGIITELLQIFTRENLHDHGLFTAGRLASLQRTLARDAHRVRPLLAVAAQRVAVQRYEAAQIALAEVRQIADQSRDRRASFEAGRLNARILDETGQDEQGLAELRRVAADARWIADDLETSGEERAYFIGHELNAQGLVMRRALDLGRRREVLAAAAAIERRTRPGEGRPVLPAHQLWDARVDAMLARVIATGMAVAEGDDDATPAQYAAFRRAALEAIGQVPAGHDARAHFWSAYLEDRHAMVMQAQGDVRKARRAAQHARDAWEALGESAHVERLEQMLAELDGAH